MDWNEVCARPELRNLPYKIELDRRGLITMSPAKVLHSVLQGEIAALLHAHRKSGNILTECAVHTHQGTRVADVAWISKDRLARVRGETECSIAPELCVEVASESNSNEELEEKKVLYFATGAQEVWICDRSGGISFHAPGETLTRSRLFPEFPNTVTI